MRLLVVLLSRYCAGFWLLAVGLLLGSSELWGQSIPWRTLEAARPTSRPQPLVITTPLHRGDTACYRYQQHEYQIDDTDTVHTTLMVRDFRLAVIEDSAATPALSFMLTAVLSRDSDNVDLTSLLANHVLAGLVGHELRLSTDTAGRIAHIEGWQELARHVQRTARVMLDEVFSTEGERLRHVNRDSLESRLSRLSDTEEHLLTNLLPELPTLFCMNGTILPLGLTREVYTPADTAHFESRLTIFADTVARDENHPYGGLMANVTLLELIPVERVVCGGPQWQARVTAPRLVAPLVDRSVDMGEGGTVKLTDDRLLSYFANGWPREFILSRRASLHTARTLRPTAQRMEQRYLIWTRMKTPRREH